MIINLKFSLSFHPIFFIARLISHVDVISHDITFCHSLDKLKKLKNGGGKKERGVSVDDGLQEQDWSKFQLRMERVKTSKNGFSNRSLATVNGTIKANFQDLINIIFSGPNLQLQFVSMKAIGKNRQTLISIHLLLSVKL